VFLCRSEGSASRGLTDKSALAKFELNQVKFFITAYARRDSAQHVCGKRPDLGETRWGLFPSRARLGAKRPLPGCNREATGGDIGGKP